MAKQGFHFDLGPVTKALNGVDDAVRDKLVKKALTDGATIIEDAARAGAPVGESAMLKESIGKKIKAFKGSGTGYAVIGPRTDVATETRQPWRYHHLVELGHINANGSFTPGNPFLKCANDTHREAALSAVADTLSAGIAAAAGGGA